jgi:hypothetical protein
VHLRPVAALLGQLMAGDGGPLTTAREPAARLAGLTRDPDAAFAELAAAYADNPRLHVPATVYNAIRNRHEPVLL